MTRIDSLRTSVKESSVHDLNKIVSCSLNLQIISF